MTGGPRAPKVRLFSEIQIRKRLNAVVRVIARARPRPTIAVPVLAGAFVFAADLLRALARQGLDLETEFIWLRSYGKAETPGQVKVLQGPTKLVRGKTVLLIDGVLDSGATLARAKTLLLKAGAARVISVVAVAKAHERTLFAADHVLFKAGADFLYGYGMDRGGRARGLPDIRVKRDRGKEKRRGR